MTTDRLYRLAQNLPLVGIEETTFAAPANTLIVANNMGFHRRGEFSGDRPRETILINFRNLEKWRR